MPETGWPPSAVDTVTLWRAQGQLDEFLLHAEASRLWTSLLPKLRAESTFSDAGRIRLAAALWIRARAVRADSRAAVGLDGLRTRVDDSGDVLERALAYLSESIDVFTSVGDTLPSMSRFLGSALGAKAEVLFDLGHVNEARQDLVDALASFERAPFEHTTPTGTSSLLEMAGTYGQLGWVLERVGAPEAEIDEALGRGLALLQSVRMGAGVDHRMAARTASTLFARRAQIRRQRGDALGAADDFAIAAVELDALTTAEDSVRPHDRFVAALIPLQGAMALMQLDRIDEARSAVDEAIHRLDHLRTRPRVRMAQVLGRDAGVRLRSSSRDGRRSR